MINRIRFIKLRLIFQILVIAIPVISLLIMYVVDDPFRVLFSYNKYTNYYTQDLPQIPVNRDFVSTEVFLRNYKRQKYDSFIFGSSRSLFILCSEWKRFITGSCYHFDASGETIFGISGKIHFLKSLNVKLANCIIVVDPFLLNVTTNSDSHLGIKHPLVSGESRLTFQYVSVSTFLSNKFFIPYLFNKLGVKTPKFLEYPAFFDKRGFIYDTLSNDIYFSSVDRQLRQDEDGFYKEYDKTFFYRDSTKKVYAGKVIDFEQKKLLNYISSVFVSDSTDFRIIIYPNYNEEILNADDLNTLQDIFGKRNIFDYSGINKFTTDKHNYYDSVHSKPFIGNEILENIYK